MTVVDASLANRTEQAESVSESGSRLRLARPSCPPQAGIHDLWFADASAFKSWMPEASSGMTASIGFYWTP